jgi:hypothetical protein
MDKPDKLATLGTQDTRHKTQDEDNQTIKHNTENEKDEQHRTAKNPGANQGHQFLPLIRHPPLI